MDLMSTLWLEHDGTIKKEISVYFYGSPPRDVRYFDEQIENQLVVSLANSGWKFDDLEDRKIGEHVPKFKLVTEKDNADVRVTYGSMC